MTRKATAAADAFVAKIDLSSWEIRTRTDEIVDFCGRDELSITLIVKESFVGGRCIIASWSVPVEKLDYNGRRRIRENFSTFTLFTDSKTIDRRLAEIMVAQ